MKNKLFRLLFEIVFQKITFLMKNGQNFKKVAYIGM